MRIHSLKLPNKLNGKISLTKKANLTNEEKRGSRKKREGKVKCSLAWLGFLVKFTMYLLFFPSQSSVSGFARE